MPIYEYCCPTCRTRFEKLRPMAESDTSATCPTCGMVSDRIMSVPANGDFGNPFTKEGEGFSSVTYGREEARERVKAKAHKEDKL